MFSRPMSRTTMLVGKAQRVGHLAGDSVTASASGVGVRAANDRAVIALHKWHHVVEKPAVSPSRWQEDVGGLSLAAI
jgi:hypothetical protein